MNRYRYVARSSDDDDVRTGELQAVSEQAARELLLAEGLRAMSVELVSGRDAAALSKAEAGEVSHQVRELLAMGAPLAEGLRAAADEFIPDRSASWSVLRWLLLIEPFQRLLFRRSDRRIRQALLAIARDIEQGENLIDALARRRVPNEIGAVLNAGIPSGRAAMAIGEYSVYSDATSRLGAHVRFLFAYPVLVVCAMWMGLNAFLMFVVPDFRELFDGFEVELPLSTQLLLGASKLVRDAGAGMALGGPLIVFAMLTLLSAWTGGPVQRVMRSMPLVGSGLRSAGLSRFSHLLAVILRHDAPVPAALRAAGVGSRDPEISRACEALAAHVDAGGRLPDADAAIPGFPLGFVDFACHGSKRDTVSQALHAVGRMFDQRARTMVTALAALVHPIVVIASCAAVLFCLISLLSPMWSLLSALA